MTIIHLIRYCSKASLILLTLFFLLLTALLGCSNDGNNAEPIERSEIFQYPPISRVGYLVHVDDKMHQEDEIICLSIRKIDVIGGDTLVLTGDYFNTYVFEYSNGSFRKFTLDSSMVVDFNSYGSISLFVKLNPGNNYEVVSNDPNLSFTFGTRPMLVDVSCEPAFICFDTLYIVDTASSRLSGYRLGVNKKWLGTEKEFIVPLLAESHISTTAYYKGHLLIDKYGFLPGYADDDDNILTVFDVFNRKYTEYGNEYGYELVTGAMIMNDTLFLLESIAYSADGICKGIRIGIIEFYEGPGKKLLHRNYRTHDFNINSRPARYKFLNMGCDDAHNILVIADENSLVLTKDDRLLHFMNTDPMPEPTTLKICGRKLFVGAWRQGLYIYNYPELTLNSRVVFTDENLKSVGFNPF